jgi:serine/threonine-protein kinase RsbW
MAPAGHAERVALVAAAWFPGEPSSVGQARDFVRGVLGEDCLVLDDVLLMASEIAANAVRHTASGLDGGWFDLTVSVTRKAVRVAVADRGGSSTPGIPGNGGELGMPGAGLLTGGRGLRIVDALASGWGYGGDERGRVVWFEVTGKPDE